RAGISLATRSFPAPVSPVMSTVESLGATRSMRLIRRRNSGLSPMKELPGLGGVRTRSRRFALWRSDRRLNANLEFVQGARFDDVIEGADTDRFDGGIDGTVSGQHDDLGRRRGGLDGLQRLQPAHTGQMQVEQDDFGFRRCDSLDCFLARAHRINFVAETTQFARHHLPECGIVIDQKEGGSLHCPCPSFGCGPGSMAGITTSNIDPFPRVLSTRMLPPQLRTAFSDRNRPRPVPPWRRLKKGSKIF